MRHFKEGSLTFTTYHGPSRKKQLKQIESYDIILTTYETIKADCPKAIMGKRKAMKEENPGGLHELRWHRVVLDEGQLCFFYSSWLLLSMLLITTTTSHSLYQSYCSSQAIFLVPQPCVFSQYSVFGAPNLDI